MYYAATAKRNSHLTFTLKLSEVCSVIIDFIAELQTLNGFGESVVTFDGLMS